MPFADCKGIRTHYLLEGLPDKPAIVFSNSLGTTYEMWNEQVAPLLSNFRVLRYDTRGHGASSIPPGDYSVTEMADDLIGVLDAVGINECYFCGLSLGGMIGMHLGVHHPERLKAVVLANTAAKIGTHETWNARIDLVRNEGTAAVADALMQRWFTPEFIAQSPDRVAWATEMFCRTDANGYASACAAVRDMDQRNSVNGIRCPTLVIAGSADPVTPAGAGEELQHAVPGSRFAALRAAHLSNVEQPEAFTTLVKEFFTAHG